MGWNVQPTRIVLVIFLALLSACSGRQGPPPRVFPVETAPAIQKDTPLYLTLMGHIIAHRNVDIRPQISGKLLQTHVEDGQDVKEGELLYTIDPAPFQAALDKAKASVKKDQAQLDFAQAKVKRYEELVKKDFVSALSYEQYQSDVKAFTAQIAADQAETAIAEVNLGYCQIRAPIDGRLGELPIDPGNIVAPTDQRPLTTLRQIAPTDVTFAISQRDFGRLQKLGQSEKMLFDVLLPKEREPVEQGQVFLIDNAFSQQTGTVQMKGTIPNHKKLLWPGEYVRVRLLLQTLPNAILVPTEAIQYGQLGAYLFVWKPDSTVDLRWVEVGEEIEGMQVVRKGVEAGEIVVTNGQLNLRQGAKTHVVKKEQADR